MARSVSAWTSGGAGILAGSGALSGTSAWSWGASATVPSGRLRSLSASQCLSSFGSCACFQPPAPSLGDGDGDGDGYPNEWFVRFTWEFKFRQSAVVAPINLIGPPFKFYLVEQPIIRTGGNATKPRTNYLVFPPNTLLPFDQATNPPIQYSPKFDAGGTIWTNTEVNAVTAETISPIGQVIGGGAIDRRGRITIEVVTTPAFTPIAPTNDVPQILYTGVGNPGRIPISGGRVDSGIVDVRENFEPAIQLVHVMDPNAIFPTRDGFFVTQDRIDAFELDFRLTVRISFRPV